jgi:hypothetical protein
MLIASSLFVRQVLEVDHFHTKRTTNNNTNNHQNQHVITKSRKKEHFPLRYSSPKTRSSSTPPFRGLFAGFRERLHGHNYRVSVRLLGERQIGADGYVIDWQRQSRL